MGIVYIKQEGAILKLQYILFSTLIFLFAAAFSAWGKPAPQSLSTHDGDDRRVTISGSDFGSALELVSTHSQVESAAGLKSCVLLGEHQVLDWCKNLSILPVTVWSEASITTELPEPLSTDPDLMYLFVIDNEGDKSPPVGPINIREGIPASSIELKLKEVVIEDRGPVETLELLDPGSEPEADQDKGEDLGPPGKPGTPEVDQSK